MTYKSGYNGQNNSVSQKQSSKVFKIKAKNKISKQKELNQTIVISFRYEAIEICIYAT